MQTKSKRRANCTEEVWDVKPVKQFWIKKALIEKFKNPQEVLKCMASKYREQICSVGSLRITVSGQSRSSEYGEK